MNNILKTYCLLLISVSSAAKNILKHYDELTNLPITSILGKLLAKQVITHAEKQTIEGINTASKKMEHLIDKIIIPSLNINVTVKFKGFLEVMEESVDPVFTNMAEELGM